MSPSSPFNGTQPLLRLTWNEPRRLTWKKPAGSAADMAQPAPLPPDISRLGTGRGGHAGEGYVETYCY